MRLGPNMPRAKFYLCHFVGLWWGKGEKRKKLYFFPPNLFLICKTGIIISFSIVSRLATCLGQSWSSLGLSGRLRLYYKIAL